MNFPWRRANRGRGLLRAQNHAHQVFHLANAANEQIQVDIPPGALAVMRHPQVGPPFDPAARGVMRSERVAVDGDIISYSAEADARVGTYVAAHPLKPEKNYFEVEILDCGVIGAIGVGVVHQRYALDAQPGWHSDSVGYHADDGKLFKATGFGRPFGPKCAVGDKIGCGIKFEQIKNDGGPRSTIPLFFTRNGKEVGTVFTHMPLRGFFPCVGLHSEGEEVRLNLDAVWEPSSVVDMSVDNCEDEWVRLHDVRISGQLLEYTGRGKSIMDVGLAQARYALDTRNHYFEIEITDPGESCYIAIGLARRDYPKHRHPGWNAGSIAYHADDGKIFIGSGVGDPFGPRCNKGDIMGCGILFPRDYNSEADSDRSRDSEDSEDSEEDFIEVEDYRSSDSEDDDWYNGPHPNTGTKVEVFFTRNGKTVGKKEVRIPRGGFFPTVGMLSSDEKIQVDLHPLTG